MGKQHDRDPETGITDWSVPGHPGDIEVRRARWGDDGVDGDVVTWQTGNLARGMWLHTAIRRDDLWHKITGPLGWLNAEAIEPHPRTWDQLLEEFSRFASHAVQRYTGPAACRVPLNPPVNLTPAACGTVVKPLIPWDRFPHLGAVGAR